MTATTTTPLAAARTATASEAIPMQIENTMFATLGMIAPRAALRSSEIRFSLRECPLACESVRERPDRSDPTVFGAAHEGRAAVV
jgi:hypothetical protein